MSLSLPLETDPIPMWTSQGHNVFTLSGDFTSVFLQWLLYQSVQMRPEDGKLKSLGLALKKLKVINTGLSSSPLTPYEAASLSLVETRESKVHAGSLGTLCARAIDASLLMRSLSLGHRLSPSPVLISPG